MAEEIGGVGGNLIKPSSTGSVELRSCEQPLVELGHSVRKAVQEHKSTVSVLRE